MSERVIVVPRWGGRPSDDWYPWLVRELAVETEVLDLPNPQNPTIEDWTAVVAAVLDEAHSESTVLVGHSVGCQALLRAFIRTAFPHRFRALVCIAGWWNIDEPWPAIDPWLEPLDSSLLQLVRGQIERVEVLISENDPFTADFRGNAEAWSDKLGATVHVVPSGKHFNAKEEPDVLRLVDAVL